MPCRCGDPTFAALGHDALGHAITGTLLRHGLDVLAPGGLTALSDRDVLDLPNAGPRFLARFRSACGGGDGAQTQRRRTRQNRPPRPEGSRAECDCNPVLLDLGHDAIGHRAAHALARQGFFAGSEARVAVLGDDELLGIRTLGLTAVARVRKRVGPSPPVVDPH